MENKKTQKIDTDSPMTTDTVKELVKQSINTNSPSLSKEEKKEHAKMLMKMGKEGLSPKEAMKIPGGNITDLRLCLLPFLQSKICGGKGVI